MIDACSSQAKVRRRCEPELRSPVGYYEPYATSHDVFDADTALEVRNVARAVGNAIVELRAGRLKPPDAPLAPARRK